MIVEKLLKAIELLLFNVLFTSDIPLPDSQFLEVLETVKNTIISCFDLFFFFVPKPVVVICFGIFVMYYAINLGYRVVMFILRKIPLLGLD